MYVRISIISSPGEYSIPGWYTINLWHRSAFTKWCIYKKYCMYNSIMRHAHVDTTSNCEYYMHSPVLSTISQVMMVHRYHAVRVPCCMQYRYHVVCQYCECRCTFVQSQLPRLIPRYIILRVWICVCFILMDRSCASSELSTAKAFQGMWTRDKQNSTMHRTERTWHLSESTMNLQQTQTCGDNRKNIREHQADREMSNKPVF